MERLEAEESFLYFAYASNMLSQRILLSSPNAIKRATAVLKDHTLIFHGYSEIWRGCKATIIKAKDSSVWGVVWELPLIEKEKLEKAELGYFSKLTTVEQSSGEKIICSVFQKEDVTSEGIQLPSRVYKNVIIQGAEEHQVPEEYIKSLKDIPDNGYNGPVDIVLNLAK